MVFARFGRKPSQPTDSTRLYYASDVHGSEICWRKFLNAASFYEVGILVMGGDLAGKGLAPVIQTEEGWTVPVAGEERHVTSTAELQQLEDLLRQSGFYPRHMSREELDRIATDAAAVEGLFEETIAAEIDRWMKLADEKLAGTAVVAYVMPGNDDPWSIDAALHDRQHVVACDDRVVRCGTHEMLSLGWSNRTPWNSPRELDEDALYRRIRALVGQVEQIEHAIFNLHVPPYGSGLDTATALDDSLRPVMVGGQPKQIPVGSTAVRQIIEEFQPPLALHGHIHESRGIVAIGRTVCINPGSNYATGRIDGAVIELNSNGVRRKHLVSG